MHRIISLGNVKFILAGVEKHLKQRLDHVPLKSSIKTQYICAYLSEIYSEWDIRVRLMDSSKHPLY